MNISHRKNGSYTKRYEKLHTYQIQIINPIAPEKKPTKKELKS